MKFYIGSGFNYIEKVRKIAQRLYELGHTVTENWWDRVYQSDEDEKVDTFDLKQVFEAYSWDEFFSHPEVAQTFLQDFEGVMNAHIFLYVSGDEPKKFNGATAEYGIAIGRGIPTYLIGELETSCLFYPLVKVSSVDEILEIERSKENGYLKRV